MKITPGNKSVSFTNKNGDHTKSIYNTLSTALTMDDNGKFQEAFVQYLYCLDLISGELRAVLLNAQNESSSQSTRDPQRMFKLAKESLSRCEKIYQTQPQLFHSLAARYKRTASVPPGVPPTLTSPMNSLSSLYSSFEPLPISSPTNSSKYLSSSVSNSPPLASSTSSSSLEVIPSSIPSLSLESSSSSSSSLLPSIASARCANDQEIFKNLSSDFPSQQYIPFPNLTQQLNTSSSTVTPTHSKSSNIQNKYSNVSNCCSENSTVPLGERLKTEDQDMISKQFFALDLHSSRILTLNEFEDALGKIFKDSGIARLIYDAFDINQTKYLELSDFKLSHALLCKGTSKEKFQYGKGFITESDFIDVLQRCYQFLQSLGLYVDMEKQEQLDLIKTLYQQCDIDLDGKITCDDFQNVVSRYPYLLQGLGLINQGNLIQRSLPRSGIPVSFGHASFVKVMNMMLGLRYTNELTKRISRMNVEPILQDFGFSISMYLPDFEMKMKMKTESSYVSKMIAFALPEDSPYSSFTEYAPIVFKAIRSHFGITEEEYMMSTSPEQFLGNLLVGNLTSMSEKKTDGKSGNFFFTSHNGMFMFKTISKGELQIFQKILKDYYEHIKKYPNTLLCRYYGLYKINNTPLIAMGNAFETLLKMTEVYDLKGSTIGRSNPGEGVKKDLDFMNRAQKIYLLDERKEQLLKQIEIDVKFLEKHSIIDYSLLLGVHKIQKSVDYSNVSIPTSVGRPFYQQYCGGMISHDKKEIYFVSIIDTLINYGFRKQAEHHVKALIHGDEHGVSVTAPDAYASRFMSFVRNQVD